MKRVAILISGSGTNMDALVRDMTGDHPARPCLVVSNNPGAGGLERAERLGVPTAVVDHRGYGKDRQAFEAALQKELDAAEADLVCLAGFMRILTADFVARWEGRMLNIHPSLLPKYRGLDTHRRALEAGDKLGGCTVHIVTRNLDEGPILGQASVPIEPDDTPETLAARVTGKEHVLYPAALRRFVGGDTTPVILPPSNETPIRVGRSE